MKREDILVPEDRDPVFTALAKKIWIDMFGWQIWYIQMPNETL